MGRVSEQTRQDNEAAIRAVMERLLAGDLPEGGKSDVRTLAAMSGVVRTGFYPKKNRDGSQRPGPYQHLAEEFERRMAALRAAGTAVDPRAAQVQRLKERNAELEQRIAERDARLASLEELKQRALSQIAAQHQEITRLKQQPPPPSNITEMTAARMRTNAHPQTT